MAASTKQHQRHRYDCNHGINMTATTAWTWQHEQYQHWPTAAKLTWYEPMSVGKNFIVWARQNGPVEATKTGSTHMGTGIRWKKMEHGIQRWLPTVKILLEAVVKTGVYELVHRVGWVALWLRFSEGRGGWKGVEAKQGVKSSQTS